MTTLVERGGCRSATCARRYRVNALPLAALTIAGLIALPIVVLVLALFAPGSAETWSHLRATVLPRYVSNSAVIALSVALGVAVIGTVGAWLTAAHEFPAKRLLEWALVLPMAMPAYVVAYAYADFLQFSGPLQTTLREVTGWRAREYWFPEIRSVPGAAALYIVVLYPYVYLPVRAAFSERSTNLLNAARLLGTSPTGAFWRVALPLARPALAAGVLLAVMETLADFGVASYFAVETLTTGIFSAWFSFADRAAAIQLSSGLLGVVLLLAWAERVSRRRRRYAVPTGAVRPVRLDGVAGWIATLVCSLPVLLGFLLPVALLARMALADAVTLDPLRYGKLLVNSFMAAGAAAAVCVGSALLIAYAVRQRPTLPVRASARLAGLGYAVPGAVLAVAILAPLARFDNALDGWMQMHFGVKTGLLLTGSIAGLVFAYVVRFLALALNSIEGGLVRITPNMDEAARSLGHGPLGVLARVHVPLLGRSLVVAALLVFVDSLKELPATLVLRPFDFDTLATRAYTLAKDERLAAAAWPSFALVITGLIPVWIVSRALGGPISSRRGRPDAAPLESASQARQD